MYCYIVMWECDGNIKPLVACLNKIDAQDQIEMRLTYLRGKMWIEIADNYIT